MSSGTASVTALRGDPYHLGHAGAATGNSAPPAGAPGGPAPKRIVVASGFGILILSDLVMVAAFFAAYAVLAGGSADGPKGAESFDHDNVAFETALPLLSSFSCGWVGVFSVVYLMGLAP
jgi:cytochrome o ubiquinol oxidase subunit 3